MVPSMRGFIVCGVICVFTLLQTETTSLQQSNFYECGATKNAWRITLLRTHLRLRREGEAPSSVNGGGTTEHGDIPEYMDSSGALLRLRGGGMFKKLKKGLALNSAEKDWIEKAMKGGVEKAVSGKKSRRELASIHRRRKPPAISSSQDLRIANRISEKAQMVAPLCLLEREIAKRLANYSDMTVSVQSVRRGGSRRPPRLKDEKEHAEERRKSLEWMGGDDPAAAPRLIDGPDGARMMDDDGDIDETDMEGLHKGKKGRGWEFDEAMRKKAAAEKAFLAKLQKERAEDDESKSR